MALGFTRFSQEGLAQDPTLLYSTLLLVVFGLVLLLRLTSKGMMILLKNKHVLTLSSSFCFLRISGN